MKAKRKYVVEYQGLDYVYEADTSMSVDSATWKEAEDFAENRLVMDIGDVIEVYALVPVAAWECVVGKDGVRRMVKVKAKSLAGDGKGGAK